MSFPPRTAPNPLLVAGLLAPKPHVSDARFRVLFLLKSGRRRRLGRHVFDRSDADPPRLGANDATLNWKRGGVFRNGQRDLRLLLLPLLEFRSCHSPAGGPTRVTSVVGGETTGPQRTPKGRSSDEGTRRGPHLIPPPCRPSPPGVQRPWEGILRSTPSTVWRKALSDGGPTGLSCALRTKGPSYPRDARGVARVGVDEVLRHGDQSSEPGTLLANSQDTGPILGSPLCRPPFRPGPRPSVQTPTPLDGQVQREWVPPTTPTSAEGALRATHVEWQSEWVVGGGFKQGGPVRRTSLLVAGGPDLSRAPTPRVRSEPHAPTPRTTECVPTGGELPWK